MNDPIRCPWPGTDPLMRAYHDTEWGVPLHDDRRLYEFMVLDAMQAGLNWQIILRKRESSRKAFDNFDPKIVASYGDDDIARLLADAGIIRNRLKVLAAVTNAQHFLDIQREFSTFDAYIWQFTGGKPIVHQIRSHDDWLATSSESDAMSKDLIKHGFKFVGSTICYAFMQAAGMINDHMVGCFRYEEVQNAAT